MTLEPLYLARLRAIRATVDDAEHIAERMGGRLMRLPAERRRRMLAAAVFAELRHRPPDEANESVPVPA